MGISNPINLSNYHGNVNITGSLGVSQTGPFSGGSITTDQGIQCGGSIHALEDLQVDRDANFGGLINVLNMPTSNIGLDTLWNNLNIVTVGS